MEVANHDHVGIYSSKPYFLLIVGKERGDAMRIGYRTIKTAIGAPLAIWLAQLIGLTNFMTAGILTILSIQPSRKRSFVSAWERVFACLLAIAFSVIFFPLLGYHPLVIGLLLIIFIPVTVSLKITEGIVTSTVILLNLYSSKDITLAFVGEQVLVIIIGLSVALLLNLYMPSLDEKLQKKQLDLETEFRKILKEIALFIQQKNMVWDGKEFIRSEEILHKASKLVMIDRENRFLKENYLYDDYFLMREKQFRKLQKMLPLVTKIYPIEKISDEIASFFIHLSEEVSAEHSAVQSLERLEKLLQHFRTKELPATRKEFETRANLFRLIYEIEEYLMIQNRFDAMHRNRQKKKTG